MKVNAWKTVDVECEVEVSLEECINEMLGMSEEEGMPWRKLQAIDGATKVMEGIAPRVLADYLAKNPKVIECIRGRLRTWMNFSAGLRGFLASPKGGLRSAAKATHGP